MSRYCALYCTKFCCLIDFLKKNHFAGYQKHATIKTQCTWIIHTMMDSSAYINVTCPLLSQFFFPSERVLRDVVLVSKQPGLSRGENTLDHTDGNAITASLQNPNH